MLKDLNVNQARFIALLAETARMQRDAILGNVAEADLGDVTPARGEHNRHRGLSEAEALGENTVTATIIEDADLHDHLEKALYETKLSA